MNVLPSRAKLPVFSIHLDNVATNIESFGGRYTSLGWQSKKSDYPGQGQLSHRAWMRGRSDGWEIDGQEEAWGDFPGSPVVKIEPSNAGGWGLIPGWGAKISHASQSKKQNIKLNQYCNKFNKDFKNDTHWKLYVKKEGYWSPSTESPPTCSPYLILQTFWIPMISMWWMAPSKPHSFRIGCPSKCHNATLVILE